MVLLVILVVLALVTLALRENGSRRRRYDSADGSLMFIHSGDGGCPDAGVADAGDCCADAGCDGGGGGDGGCSGE